MSVRLKSYAKLKLTLLEKHFIDIEHVQVPWFQYCRSYSVDILLEILYTFTTFQNKIFIYTAQFLIDIYSCQPVINIFHVNTWLQLWYFFKYLTIPTYYMLL